MDNNLFYILITVLIVIFSTKIYDSPITYIASNGIMNKLCLLLILFIVSFENYLLGILLMIILLDIIIKDTYNNEHFQCKFHHINNDREP